jgi:oligosaccharide repeat unit polymerase
MYSPLIFLTIGSIISLMGGSFRIKKTKAINNLMFIKTPFRSVEKSATILVLIVVLFVAMQLITKSLNMGFGIQEIRTFIYNPEFEQMRNTNQVFKNIAPILWFLNGLIYYLVFLTLYNLLITRELQSYHYLVINFFSLIVLNTSMGGRFSFIYIISILIGVLVLILLYNKNVQQYLDLIKKISLIRIIIPTLFLLIFIVSIFRSTDTNFFIIVYEYFIRYYIGPIYAYDMMLLTDKIADYSDVRFGIAFRGLDTLIVSGFLRFIGSIEIESIQSEISYLFQNGIKISDKYITNAHYTVLFPIYLDGGIIYIYIYMTMVGYFITKVFKKMIANITLLNFTLFLIIVMYILDFPLGSITQKPGIAICLFLILIRTIMEKRKTCVIVDSLN